MRNQWNDYNNVKISNWPLRYFTPLELATAGSPNKPDRLLLVHWPSANALEELRRCWGKPLIINSAYRSLAHNTAVGGARSSLHMKAQAFDIALNEEIRAEFDRFLRMAYEVGFRGFGFYDNFVHVDTGAQRTWDQRSDRSQIVALPWDQAADGGDEVDIRAIPAPPRPPKRAGPAATTATGGATIGGAVLAVSQIVETSEGSDNTIFLIIAAIAVLALGCFIGIRFLQDLRGSR